MIFFKIYKPKVIKESDENIYNVEIISDEYKICIDGKIYNKNPITNTHNCLCMYYSRLQLHDMLNEEYDIVISTRMDLIFHSNISIKDLESYIANDYICIPNEKYDYGGINDQIAIGNRKTMSMYFSLYSDLLNILESSVYLHPETVLAHFLQKNNTKLHRFYIDYEIYKKKNKNIKNYYLKYGIINKIKRR